MSKERKILIVAGIIIVALAIFGFKGDKQHICDNNCNHDSGFGNNNPINAPAFEYQISNFHSSQNQNWQDRNEYRQMQEHLNDMGAMGWELVHVEEGNFAGEYVFLFTRPVARWR